MEGDGTEQPTTGSSTAGDGGSSQVRVTVTPAKHPRHAEGLLLGTFEEEPGADEGGPPEALSEPVVDEPMVRELESSSEEVTSVNEELETSKEELQSLNEELATVNDQLHEKVAELEGTNNDLANLLRSSEVGTLFLDRELRVKLFTDAMLGLFNLLPGDTDRPIADLAPKFSDPELPPDARDVLRRLVPVSREVAGDDGRWYLRRVVPYRTHDDRIDGVVVTFIDVTELKRVQADLKTAKERLEDTVDRHGSTIDLLHRVAVDANRAASVEEAVAGVLPKVARHLGAVFGQVWLVDDESPGTLRVRGQRFSAREDRTAALAAAPDDRLDLADLPLASEALGHGRAQWSVDLEAALGPDRGSAAARADIGEVLMIPILAGSRALGAVELAFEHGDLQREHLVVLAASVGGDLGGVVERVGLQRKLSDLGEQEQRRIGKELHDTVAQEIAGVRLLAESLRHHLEPGSQAIETVERLVEAAIEAQAHVRSLARGLVPVVIAAGGLRPAVEALLERMAAEHGLRCELVNPSGVVVEDSQVATNLYYIVQEAVRNAVAHGEARHVTVELGRDGRALLLRVVDDGCGFDPEAADVGCGSGLRIMRYRSRIVGARLDIASEPGAGTTVTCTLER